jgi:hypothetical protein
MKDGAQVMMPKTAMQENHTLAPWEYEIWLTWKVLYVRKKFIPL